jgi:hypothetical protein
VPPSLLAKADGLRGVIDIAPAYSLDQIRHTLETWPEMRSRAERNLSVLDGLVDIEWAASVSLKPDSLEAEVVKACMAGYMPARLAVETGHPKAVFCTAFDRAVHKIFFHLAQ